MATVTHYIYSHYDPQQREALERATGQIPSEAEQDDPWQTESSFGARRSLANAPRFVPAIVSYDQINNMMGVPPPAPEDTDNLSSNDVSSWYKSLTRSTTTSAEPACVNAPSISSSKTLPLTDSPSALTTGPAAPERKRGRRTQEDWFIARALRSEPSPPRSGSTETLADILSRDPPPLPREQPFRPPVFLAIGPSNKGFAMLQQSGWSEGEPLGPGVVRRQRQPSHQRQAQKRAKQEKRVTVKQEEHEVWYDEDGDISEMRTVDVIDLTLSDEEEEDIKQEDASSVQLTEPSTSSSAVDSAMSSHNPRALLTPLPTVLKSDRLGVGLKAKTVGPYRASRKRVTHNEAALAAHVRANEEMRRMKKLMGRGSKGLARLAKAENEQRLRVLASLKDG
ncbi:hypothetical protein IEO21_01154 [Rhodonia placenta]|uniref:G-patch domain-containing protein n=1 Tax=Rhodonia placenta TaxID=104341 RepID=A0A8H7P9Y6_9APHY|nr:hypothetical protein IEO21_01154 [Postia placenta]